MDVDDLTEREQRVLEAVIRSYVETAEPAGSRTIAKRFALGVSAATIRNTMSDLEERGYLYHPHTSAGRIPTDLAYRVYVDNLMWPSRVPPSDQNRLQRELTRGRSVIEDILEKAAQVLGVLTQELGVAAAPSLDNGTVEQLELVYVSSERLLMVLVLKSVAARTIFVEVSNSLPREAIAKVSQVLNERLRGLTLKEIRATVHERLRDTGADPGEGELLNIFVEESDVLFDGSSEDEQGVVLGSTQMLADQPEFNSNEQMRALLDLTEHRDVLREALHARRQKGMTVTIGGENLDPKLRKFTIVTSTYQCGAVSGVIGVMGPTRMPYDKVLALVEYTSKLMGDFAE